jgi:heme-degrading monooxygenase HmoA
MIFEFSFDVATPSNYEQYLTEAAQLRELLPSVDGFEGIKRFESVNEPRSFVAIGFFRDEAAVAHWRNAPEHRRVQALGRNRLFATYRLRMAEVMRDYGRLERADAPPDSRAFHEGLLGPDRSLRRG